MGLSRDQVLDRLGEPRSQISTGGREVMFYPRERLVLSNGVVVEVERLASEPARKSPPPELPAARESSKTADPTTAANPAADASTRAVEPPVGATPAESKLEIKLLRPRAGVAPAPVAESVDATPRPPAPAPSFDVTSAAPVSSPPSSTASRSAAKSAITSEPAATPASEPAAAPVKSKAAPSTAAPAAPPSDISNTPAAPASGTGLGTATYAVAGALLLGGVGYLVWRSRQRQLELDATAVEATPVGAAAASRAAEAGFSLEFLAQLQAASFEELVAAYYVKTGVVAERVPSDAASPFQIRISWKGEARAFALVQCLAQPAGIIETQPLMRLHAVLDKEMVRRGYVITPGKFSAKARELAEEKGLTLLPGDVFLEKLMALPDSARSELMRAVSSSNRAPA